MLNIRRTIPFNIFVLKEIDHCPIYVVRTNISLAHKGTSRPGSQFLSHKQGLRPNNANASDKSLKKNGKLSQFGTLIGNRKHYPSKKTITNVKITPNEKEDGFF